MSGDPKKKDDDHTTFIHNMSEGDSVLIGDNLEIHLKETKPNRSVLRIKAPRSVTIRPKPKKAP
jgi:hypothetical protein